MRMDNRNIKTLIIAFVTWTGTGAAAAQAQTVAAASDPAVQFGAQASVSSAELSPDGKRIAYIGPGSGTSNVLFVIDIAARKSIPVVRGDGQPMRLTRCSWVSSDRIICNELGLLKEPEQIVSYTRMFALDADGKNLVALGRRDTSMQLYARQFDGHILDWLNGDDSKVLVERYYVPEMSTGRRTAQTDEGYGVDLLDTRTQKSTTVERPKLNAHYWSDGRGEVRLMVREEVGRDQLLTGKVAYYYRVPGERDWREFKDDDFSPLAVDSGANAAYVLKELDGHRALYRISLDASLKTELVFLHPLVDIDDVVTIGRSGRVIGAQYNTDRPQVTYFDPTYKQLAVSLARAIPDLPIISFVSASADENVLLIYAGSDNQPGRYYLMDRSSNRLTLVMDVRPALQGVQLAQVRAVSYPVADGTEVPAYLTLPPGVDKTTGLPAIVMPHGGPASRDVWGFNWLVQYYANRGFAVLQPNFRGSAGYGGDWFVENGYKSWKTAVGDVNDSARWLIAQGIADPQKLAIVGWSYGGYAALQSNVVDPGLFKAVVAIAPVTDLQMAKDESEGFTNELLQRDYIGSGPHIEEGSPARHAEQFKAPVLLFHGDIDANVDVAESKAMDKALHRAGKQSELILYPALDHQLFDDAARADMLRRSYEFLRINLNL
jgi:dipeptidyl aminopeptidase/acylaminoacyl peptidase